MKNQGFSTFPSCNKGIDLILGEMSSKVLIIDNNPSESISSRLLSSAGYSVDVSRDVNNSLHGLSRQSPDVIIVQEAPGTESWNLCTQIRRVTRMPLIVISSNPSKETSVRAINAGADYFLRRPGRLELVARVKSLLRRARLN